MSTLNSSPIKQFTDAELIFLVSQPRAGSTLLQSILAGSDEIHTTAEPWFMLHAMYALRETGHTAEYDARVASRALQDFLSTLSDGEEAYYSALHTMACKLYGQASHEAGKSRFLDKTPRYYKILPELARTFPQARFIILLRNPAAVLSSIIRTWVNGEWNRFEYFREDLLTAPGLLTEFANRVDHRAYVVHYEEVITDSVNNIQSLCAWLGVPFQPEMLEYGRNARPAGRYGDPSGVDKFSRPVTSSGSAWLDHVSDPQIHSLVASYLNALGVEQITRMGYDYGQLMAGLEGVDLLPGKISVSWHQLMKVDKSVAERIQLIMAEARREKRPFQAAKQIARILVNR